MAASSLVTIIVVCALADWFGKPPAWARGLSGAPGRRAGLWRTERWRERWIETYKSLSGFCLKAAWRHHSAGLVDDPSGHGRSLHMIAWQRQRGPAPQGV